MKFIKGFSKYCVYLFIAAWMFFLGIMVGRENSPVKFDTQKFQKRLETIAHDFGAQKETPGKIDLKFYEVLDRPDLEKKGEILPQKQVLIPESIPVKISKKKETLKKGKVKIWEEKKIKPKKPEKIKQVMEDQDKNRDKPKIEPELKPGIKKGRYTVQIAAYKDFKDAVTQMAVLQEKGFSSYRVKGLKDGKTWYRVRSGSFANFDEANRFKKKLENYKINSLIIKSD
ncbi:MAG: SPOR domain-containing protein [Desulfobacula sp.]|nr:SPOR domain-containing protein [Desulfobacula sp.]